MSNQVIMMTETDKLECKIIMLKVKCLEEQIEKYKLLIDKNINEINNLKSVEFENIISKYDETMESEGIDKNKCIIDFDNGVITKGE